MSTEREQKLIDIMFEVASVTASSWPNAKYNREAHMEWVAEQLRQCGFDTIPCGASWGVLKNNG